MNCEDRKDLLMDYALGQLDPLVQTELRNHLEEGCEACGRELAEVSDAWASLAISLDPVKVPPAITERLMATIRSDKNLDAQDLSAGPLSKDHVVLDTSTPSPSANSRVIPYVIAATLLGAMAAVVSWKALSGVLDIAENSRGSTKQEMWGDLAHDQPSSGFRTVGLKQLAGSKDMMVSIVRNESVNQWHVLVAGLPTTKPDSTLQLWAELKTGDFLSLATLLVGDSGTSSSLIDLPQGAADYAEIWLTIDDFASAERPSEEVLFRAALE
ncbi:anti-sigma factor [Bythopirellula polymerisocia]|uniref:Anti-sigma-K factor rskA n=1 Tax=Bythopirellula polymerisocia TaxID=2528003 RepID=A0A5C6CH75_9BACT|nr:anti-sigma factor [Bythopirellula polymerisocia]TWU23542.1 hypothetical protein Pla144_37170 [Bythopirellula polymerisocia]